MAQYFLSGISNRPDNRHFLGKQEISKNGQRSWVLPKTNNPSSEILKNLYLLFIKSLGEFGMATFDFGKRLHQYIDEILNLGGVKRDEHDLN